MNVRTRCIFAELIGQGRRIGDLQLVGSGLNRSQEAWQISSTTSGQTALLRAQHSDTKNVSNFCNSSVLAV